MTENNDTEYIQQLENERDELLQQIEKLNQDVEDLSMVKPEAAGVAWADFYGWATDKTGIPRQVKISVTCRSVKSGLDATEQLLDAAKELKAKNIFPYQTDRPGRQSTETKPEKPENSQPGKPATPAAPAGVPAGAPPATSAAGTPAALTGSGRLKSITVGADLKVSFEVEGLRWPLKDSRGANVVAGLFDQSLGWTPAHFQTPAVYTDADFGTIQLDWEKKDKYYDVKLIHA